MKTKQIILAAALLGGLLSATALATTTEAHAKSVAVVKFVAPVPLKVVGPIDMSRSLVGVTLKLSLTIDAAGVPHNVKIISPHDEKLTRNVITAVSQWQFTPALLNGVPITVKAELPLQLVES